MKLRVKFTKWYVKKGYTFSYAFAKPGEEPKVFYKCPIWVKPLLIFFSPSIYTREKNGGMIAAALAEGLENGLRQGAELRKIFLEKEV